MNSTNCPPGFATDELVQLSSDPCSISLPLYVSLFSILCLLRFVAFIYQALDWRARYYRQKRKEKNLNDGNRNKQNKKKRYPLMPFLSFIIWIVLIIFTILTSLGIATVRNNGSIALICIFWLPQFVAAYISVQRIYRLGKRILPLAQLNILNDRNLQLDRLDKMDLFVVFLRSLAKISFFVNPVALLIFGFIYPGNYIPITVGFSCYIFQNILMLSGLVYQYQRVITVVSAVIKENTSGDNEEVRGALRRLRRHQIAYVLLATPGALFWLIPLSTLVPFYWWFIFLEFTTEVLSIVGLAFAFHGKPRRKKSKLNEDGSKMGFPISSSKNS